MKTLGYFAVLVLSKGMWVIGDMNLYGKQEADIIATKYLRNRSISDIKVVKQPLRRGPNGWEGTS